MVKNHTESTQLTCGKGLKRVPDTGLESKESKLEACKLEGEKNIVSEDKFTVGRTR